MFGNKNNGNTTIIGRGARFVGTLELEGTVHIEGRCEGTIRAQGHLSVGPNGCVVGELAGKVVTIAGRVEGTVVAQDSLHVVKTGGVKGDAYYGRLQVDSGGVIDGQSHQGAPANAGLEVGEVSVEQTGVIDARVKPISVYPPGVESARAGAAGKW